MRIQTITIYIIVLFSFLFNVNAQEQQSKEEKDWKKFNDLKLLWYSTPEEKAEVESPSLLVYKRYEDKVYTKRAVMAEKFMDTYPESVHYKEALRWYLSAFFLPVFIPDSIEKERLEILTSFYGPDKWKGSDRFQRVLPIDKRALARWLEKGDNYAANFLASNASQQDKFEVEQSLINREIFLATRWLSGLEKKPLEEDFWEQFHQHYWETFYQRIEKLFNKYSELDSMTKYAKLFVTFVSGHSRVPSLKTYYWQRFYDFTKTPNNRSNHTGIKALQEVALENLKAINSLTIFDENQPLEISFTAMDGTKVDLKKMRGKVVLIDFWSTYCPPCIKEMPYVRALYDKYKSKGFEVIGIADNGDRSRDQVLKILEKTGATWPQRLDKSSGADVSYHSLYNIKSLPTVWLLDKKGVIVDRNARGERLEPLIRKFLDLDK